MYYGRNILSTLRTILRKVSIGLETHNAKYVSREQVGLGPEVPSQSRDVNKYGGGVNDLMT